MLRVGEVAQLWFWWGFVKLCGLISLWKGAYAVISNWWLVLAWQQKQVVDGTFWLTSLENEPKEYIKLVAWKWLHQWGQKKGLFYEARTRIMI